MKALTNTITVFIESSYWLSGNWTIATALKDTQQFKTFKITSIHGKNKKKI